MSYLDFVDDQSLIDAVKYVLDKARKAKNDAPAKFYNNVIDPFSAYFEAGGFKLPHDAWRQTEEIRQAQKTLQNHVGVFHQKILGSIAGWNNLNVGGNIDLKCEEKRIIAEIKNKHNTVTGAKLIADYKSLEELVMPNASIYKGYTAYFVNIVPKKPIRSNKVFTPSDKAKSAPCASNEKIRIIDGVSFYDLATGKENSLKSLYDVLPRVIEEAYETYYPDENFTIEDNESFSQYFAKAFGTHG